MQPYPSGPDSLPKAVRGFCLRVGKVEVVSYGVLSPHIAIR